MNPSVEHLATAYPGTLAKKSNHNPHRDLTICHLLIFRYVLIYEQYIINIIIPLNFRPAILVHFYVNLILDIIIKTLSWTDPIDLGQAKTVGTLNYLKLICKHKHN